MAKKQRQRIVFYSQLASLILLLSVLFVPFYQMNYDGGVTVLSAFNARNTELLIVNSVVAVTTAVMLILAIVKFVKTLMPYLKCDDSYFDASRDSVKFNLITAIVFFALGIVSSMVLVYFAYDTTTRAFIPLIIELLSLIAHGFICAKYDTAKIKGGKKRRPRVVFRIIIIVFVLAFLVLALLAFSLNLITVTITEGRDSGDYSIQLFEIMQNCLQYGEGLQTVAFFGSALFTLIIIATCLAVAAAVFRSRDYIPIAKVAIITDFIAILMIAMFCKYYQIAQYANLENIEMILESYGLSSIPVYEDFNVTSQVQPLLYVAAGLAGLLIIIKPFTREQRELDRFSNPGFGGYDGDYSLDSSLPMPTAGDGSVPGLFDSCPVFTDIDRKIPQFEEANAAREANAMENPSLPGLVTYIVDYARESRLHLSYTPEEIAAFIAGLGASKLAILQGMSGTGKTSLPKIFAEAIMGQADIIEVESSWKDKNELVGYYNEFSRVFTPKKFTQALYRASLNPEVVTLIVLDEMNLSRIEYYFSDFLSLMENEPDKREIRLLNFKLANTLNGARYEFKALTDGNTIKISPNVWFVGTANRDESTFEISDKVYDRACTMNFDRRAPKARAYMQPQTPKYISYTQFEALIENATSASDFDIENCDVVSKVDALLRPYNISFGNRIAGQMESFVKIYCACFGNRGDVMNEAVEKILLSKVVAKLEFKAIPDKEQLAKQFDKLELKECAAFIRKLNEDSMYE